MGFVFLQESLDLINFDRNWFLIDIDFCKPGVIEGLSLNFNLFLEIFFRGALVYKDRIVIFLEVRTESLHCTKNEVFH